MTSQLLCGEHFHFSAYLFAPLCIGRLSSAELTRCSLSAEHRFPMAQRFAWVVVSAVLLGVASAANVRINHAGRILGTQQTVTAPTV